MILLNPQKLLNNLANSLPIVKFSFSLFLKSANNSSRSDIPVPEYHLTMNAVQILSKYEEILKYK